MLDADELVVGLGGNRGGEGAVRARFAEAMAAARVRLPGAHGLRRAGVYRSAPVGPVADQPDFLNTAFAVTVDPATDAVSLLATLLDIEARLGRARAREVSQGPRPIDIDMLLWGGRQVQVPGPPRLSLPHPRLASRRFVLAPLADLVGTGWTVPGTAATVGALLAACADQRVDPVS